MHFSRWESGWMFPRRWMLPSLGSSLDNMDLFKDKDSELIRVKQDSSSIEVKFYISICMANCLRKKSSIHHLTLSLSLSLSDVHLCPRSRNPASPNSTGLQRTSDTKSMKTIKKAFNIIKNIHLINIKDLPPFVRGT